MDRFSDKPWEQRIQSMGDQAEGEFESRHTKWARYGFNRPDINMSRNTPQVNYTPDYVLERYATNVLVEIQGCGKDQAFKFKDDKIISLKRWQTFSEMPVAFWLWDAVNERAFWISVDELHLRSLRPRLHGGETGSFPEGKTFVQFSAESFDLENVGGR